MTNMEILTARFWKRRFANPPARERRVTFCLAFSVAIAAAGELRAQGFLIPDTTRRDMVFDSAGQNLYISTSTGLIKTFHLSTLTFGTSYDLGGSLNGVDIARDNSFLLAAQNNVGISEGTFQRADLTTGIITNIPYTLTSGEGGAWDVAIASNGLALITTQFQGSGWTPLRQIDLATNAVSIRMDAPGSNGSQLAAPTQVHRSADGTRFFFMEGNISSGPVFTYNAITNTFGPSFDTNGYLDPANGAVNRNGNLIALRPNGTAAASLNTAPDFNFLHSFNGIDGGVAFDAVRDVFYGVNSTTDQIIAYSTTTFAELFRLNIGENVEPGGRRFGTGRLVASADGARLALETPSGIRLFQPHAAFFMGEIPLGNGIYYLQFPNGTPFGYYAYLSDPHWIYHFDMGYEYWFDANDGHNGIFFYDFASGHFFYTSPSFPFPYLYDFSLNAVLYYFPICRDRATTRLIQGISTTSLLVRSSPCEEVSRQFDKAKCARSLAG